MKTKFQLKLAPASNWPCNTIKIIGLLNTGLYNLAIQWNKVHQMMLAIWSKIIQWLVKNYNFVSYPLNDFRWTAGQQARSNIIYLFIFRWIDLKVIFCWVEPMAHTTSATCAISLEFVPYWLTKFVRFLSGAHRWKSKLLKINALLLYEYSNNFTLIGPGPIVRLITT